ncbi:uncharacterized protein PGTG_22314 [Puccinia graminis f. sp. tritici CRL 75-36-700-3]|uniref:Tc1-like transposase DDE domain-containing protein n=1 Tax=Puccinia graminis f. sp. tritici (strain CRL 75-36-700-3 / race SCCL) TaxID=418459 RepID=H6QU63_PUCGT|nr:uncharacterized protein PGTG_22314 [Puccinia graminis f. sp. tritici CRL 75-36-700-3]EHS64526.1 hypothetical protein PGTG_22314 [Puccinia graminis f. sp. tritici CRL 75-36-700-3]
MPYFYYPPNVKVMAVCMTLEGKTRDNIRQALGFQISKQSFNRWREHYEQTRRVIRNPEEYERLGRPRTLTSEDCTFMLQLVRNEPGLFLDEIREKVYDATGTLLSVEAVHENLVNNLLITLKKAETLNSRKCLLKKYRYVARMSFYPANYLVFTDESAICDRALLRTHSRSPCGTPAARYIIRQNPERFSILPAISINGIIALKVRDDTYTGIKFEHFLKWTLLPRMNKYPSPNSVLVCDNARIHRGRYIEAICDKFGVRVIYLPPYCLELNPIELCFANVKSHLRRTQALSVTDQPEALIHRACVKVMTASLCHKLYRHCGYVVPSLEHPSRPRRFQ